MWISPSNQFPFDQLHVKSPGTIQGFVFGAVRARPTPVVFISMVPLDKGFENPRYIKAEQRFSKKVKPSSTHDCIVTVGRDISLISAYQKGGRP